VAGLVTLFFRGHSAGWAMATVVGDRYRAAWRHGRFCGFSSCGRARKRRGKRRKGGNFTTWPVEKVAFFAVVVRTVRFVWVLVSLPFLFCLLVCVLFRTALRLSLPSFTCPSIVLVCARTYAAERYMRRCLPAVRVAVPSYRADYCGRGLLFCSSVRFPCVAPSRRYYLPSLWLYALCLYPHLAFCLLPDWTHARMPEPSFFPGSAPSAPFLWHATSLLPRTLPGTLWVDLGCCAILT